MVYRKRFIAVILFFLGLAGIIMLASLIVIPKNNTADAGMEETDANGILGEPQNTIDVLILGDSESYSAFSPLEIWKKSGYTSYVCGTSSQKLPYSYTMLQRALKHQKPKIVILETLTIYRNFTSGDMLTNALGEVFTVFRYHDRWKKLHTNDFISLPSMTYQHNEKGHIVDYGIDPSSNQAYMLDSYQNAATIKSENKQYVRAIQRLCKRNGAKFVLISTPSTINWNYARHNGIQTLASELGCEYIDLNLMNDELNIDWKTDTRDQGDHLNQSGAVKVSDFLAQYLVDTRLLKNHQLDSAYENWEIAAKKSG